MLSQEALSELSDILRTDYGKDCTPAEVFEIGQGIVEFFDRLMEFDFKNKNDNENERLHKTV